MAGSSKSKRAVSGLGMTEEVIIVVGSDRTTEQEHG